MNLKSLISGAITSAILLAAPVGMQANAAQGCDETKPGLCRVFSDLSSILSSTNPKQNAQKARLVGLPTAAGGPEPLQSNNNNPVPIKNVSPTNIPFAMEPIGAPPASQVPVNTPRIQGTVVNSPMLTPETKRLLRELPANIDQPKSSSPRLIDIQRGMFEQEDVPMADSGEATEPPPPPKAKFEIEVKDVSTVENEISMLEKARKALLYGQYESSIALYKAVLNKLPKNRDALFGLATAYHRSGQRTQAKLAYVALLTAYPNHQDGLNNFLVLAGEEAPQDALSELTKLEARNPNYAQLYAQKAVIYTKLNDYQNAVLNFRKAISINPENPNYIYNLAAIYDQVGDKDNALKLYGALLDLEYKGQMLPVSRGSIQERMQYLSSQSQAAVN